VLDNAADCSDTGAMTGDTGQSAMRRPASIAVHDDGYVKTGVVLFALHCKVSWRIARYKQKSLTIYSEWPRLAESRTNQSSA